MQVHEKTSKDVIRRRIQKVRKSLDEAKIISKSLEIEKLFFKLTGLENINNLLIYMACNKEVQTKRIINKCLERNIKIYLPTIDKERIFFYRVFDINNELEKGPFGIYQPKTNKQNLLKDKNEIDLIVVPGLAFDEKGGRIGYGKGYYDKFLRMVPPDKSIIAFAFEFQVVRETILFSHDVPVHKIVTEKRIISCMEG